MARPSKYQTDVASRFDEIKKWCELGATDKEICENLGLSSSAYFDYKKKYREFKELIKKSRKVPILEIKAALYKRAIGFQYSEKKIITASDGYWKEEVYTRTALPDQASAMILLKHWAKDEGWTNDPQLLQLKKKELEIKEKSQEEWS